MYQKTVSRQDLFQIALFQLLFIAASIFGLLLLHPLVGFGMYVFLTGMVPFVNDMVSKDHHTKPLFRCDGCGNLYSESKATTWRDYQFCEGCMKDSPQQREFAVTIPNFVKRLRKQ